MITFISLLVPQTGLKYVFTSFNVIKIPLTTLLQDHRDTATSVVYLVTPTTRM